MLFQPPPPTRYDLNFRVAGTPVRVHPLFWLIMLFLGASTGDLVQILIWAAAVFLSILIHELGHALAMRRFGIPSYVVLYWGGGLTVPAPERSGYGERRASPGPNEEIAISLAGPGTGFLFAALIIGAIALAGGTVTLTMLFGFIPIPMAVLPAAGRILNLFAASLLWVNLFWGVVNLMPVYPLDGGNVTRYLLLKADPWGGIRTSLWISVVAGGVVALFGFLVMRSTFIGLLFGLLAFQSFQALQGRA
jgi:stage IV sporulation protein FB